MISEYDQTLQTLKKRFLHERSIYTWCGIALVAVNPYQELDIYGDQAIETYHASSGHVQLEPHIYAVSEDAYSKLERNGTDQSIIVSGESGAGKTVSAKYSMRYFASIACSRSTNIENRVLASNPIMEAIGNASTVRNDNSSRFGKYIRILFDRQNRTILGGNMRTYLLEKSRVTKQQHGERNFHIFYQLVNYACKHDIEYLKLDAKSFYKTTHNEIDYDDEKELNFKFLGNMKPHEQIDDTTKFSEALSTLGVNEKRRDVIFRIIAAILHGGNIRFKRSNIDKNSNHRDQDEDIDCHVDTSDQHFQTFCDLLGLDKVQTAKWLTTRLLRTGAKEIISTPLNSQMAEYGRDAMLKFIYERLFAWIVALINNALGSNGADDTIATQTPTVIRQEDTQFIGVLDIYGFENFDHNSFEQFCINYANEVLQQQFNQHVFKLEQDEYIREGIDWTFIEFSDNQPVIDIIEAKPIGILNLLDEECKMPRGSDETWCAKLYAQLSKMNGLGNNLNQNRLGGSDNIFEKPKFNYQNSFNIKHFAEKVTYEVQTFLEKNRDTVWEEQIDLLKQSNKIRFIFDDPLVPTITKQANKKKVATVQSPASTPTKSKPSKATVGSQFRESLASLMCILNKTEPHYIRCIKPNDSKAAFEFDDERAVQQLKACGVYETIRISTNGFPSRWHYKDFARRYSVLIVGHNQYKQLINGFMNEARQQSKVQHSAINQDQPTKLRSSSVTSIGQLATYDPKAVCTAITDIVYLQDSYACIRLREEEEYQKSLIERHGSVNAIFQFGKTKLFFRSGQVSFLERIRAQKLRDYSTKIQRHIRGWLARKAYQKKRSAAITIQAYYRRHAARKLFNQLRQTRAAIRIQSKWRCYITQQRYSKLVATTIRMQARVRGLLARKQLIAIRKYQAAVIIQSHWRGLRQRKNYQAYKAKIIIAQAAYRRWSAKKIFKALKQEARSVEHMKKLNRGLEIKIIELQQKLSETSQNQKVYGVEHKKYIDKKDQLIRSLRNEVQSLRLELDYMRKDKEEQLEELQLEKSHVKELLDKLNIHEQMSQEWDAERKKTELHIKQIIEECQAHKAKRVEIEHELISFRNSTPLTTVKYISNDQSLTINNNSKKDQQPQMILNQSKSRLLDLVGLNISINNNNQSSLTSSHDSGPTSGDFAPPRQLGMLRHDSEDEDLIVDVIINHLEVNDLPTMEDVTVPANALFMCIRYIDHINDEPRVQSLLTKMLNNLKRIAKKSDSVELMTVWLVNSCKIVNYLRQYSSDEGIYGVFDETLKNFDLSDFRLLYDELVDLIYQALVRLIYSKIQPLIIGAVLEHEGLASSGVEDDQQPGNDINKGRKSSSPNLSDKPMEALLRELNNIHDLINHYNVYQEIALQIYKQLFYLICATSLNQLLLRKDLCHWNKAIQIRFNLSCLEQWCREKQLVKWQEIVEQLDPITQSTKLLQTRKTAEHIITIAEMCNKLRSSQIIKILNLYTSSYEEQISTDFIRELQDYLNKNRISEADSTHNDLLMNTKHLFPITVAYRTSNTKFQNVRFPMKWIHKNLPAVLHKI